MGNEHTGTDVRHYSACYYDFILHEIRITPAEHTDCFSGAYGGDAALRFLRHAFHLGDCQTASGSQGCRAGDL